MVLLAAAICSKQGKILVSRQFVEMNRSRIEGLLTTFTKLLESGNTIYTMDTGYKNIQEYTGFKNIPVMGIYRL